MGIELRFAGIRPLWEPDGGPQKPPHCLEEAACGILYLVPGSVSPQELLGLFMRADISIRNREKDTSDYQDHFKTASGFSSY